MDERLNNIIKNLYSLLDTRKAFKVLINSGITRTEIENTIEPGSFYHEELEIFRKEQINRLNSCIKSHQDIIETSQQQIKIVLQELKKYE